MFGRIVCVHKQINPIDYMNLCSPAVFYRVYSVEHDLKKKCVAIHLTVVSSKTDSNEGTRWIYPLRVVAGRTSASGLMLSHWTPSPMNSTQVIKHGEEYQAVFPRPCFQSSSNSERPKCICNCKEVGRLGTFPNRQPESNQW